MGEIKYDWVPLGGFPKYLQFKPQHKVHCRKSGEGRVGLKVLSVFLIFLITIDGTFARPMNQRNSHKKKVRSKAPKPKWVNPCGINPQFIKNHALQAYHEIMPLTDRELLQNVILSARNALIHSDAFKEKFVRRTFSTPSWEEHHQYWKDQRLDWLPSYQDIPKHLSEKVHHSHLSSLKMDSALLKIYNYLQKIAVGLEQVVMDQAVYDGDFIQEFNEAEYKLKAVLCELQVAMLERGIEQEQDVSRDIMPDESKYMEDSSYRNQRDWYIYRDYMNGLEYVIHSFDHLKKLDQ